MYILTDSRILCYLPSVVASAIMCLVIKEVDDNNALEYQNQLLGILKISKVVFCYMRIHNIL